ncbi:MAG: hypothetical protein AAFZ52_06855 [Bacteroidota bacterium]
MAATGTLNESIELVDTKNHQIITNGDGEKTGVIIPYAEYENMMYQLRHSIEYLELERSLHRALDEVQLMREGKLPIVTLEAFLDEL